MGKTKRLDLDVIRSKERIRPGKRNSHIILASHANLKYKETLPVNWGAKSARERGPVVASLTNAKARNAIGEQFETERLVQCLSNHGRKRSADVLEHMRACQRAFCDGHPYSDDVTLLTVGIGAAIG